MKVSNSEMPVVTVPPSASSTPEADGRWWKLPDERLHASVSGVVNSISKSQQQLESEHLRHARLYANRDLLQLVPGGRSTLKPQPSGPSRLRVNVVKSCVDTAAAMISKQKPRPQFVTSDGDAPLQRKAKWLTRYVDGVFYDGGAHEEAQRAFVDACIFGTGAVRLYWERDRDDSLRLRFERALPWELLVDEEDGRYGRPKQLHHVRLVYPDVLAELFPEKADAIALAVDPTSQGAGRSKVRVVESWHLPSGPKAKDGRHAITINGATLFSEPWDLDFFPYSFMRWSERVVGFWGCGLAEELAEVQAEINRTAIAIQQAQHLAAVPRVLVEAGSNVVASHVSNLPGGVLRYTGRAPTFFTAQAMNAEAYQWLEANVRRAYELTGISQLQATAQKPAGLSSGVALREYNDTAAVRFARTGQRWEDLFLDMARKAIAMSREAYRSGERGLSVKASDGRFLRQVKWSEVDLDDDRFHMKAFPTSLLPTTPAGKLQTVQELIQAGLIPKEQAVALLDFPDVEAFTSLQTAALEDVRWCIDRIMEEGKPVDVDEVTDLDLAVRLGMSAALRAKRNGEPEERQEVLRAWVEACRAKLEEATKPPPPPASQAQPIAQPAAQPVSDLLPVAEAV